MFTKQVIKLAKPCYEAIKIIAKSVGKVWKWEPEWGEFCIDSNKRIVLIWDIFPDAPIISVVPAPQANITPYNQQVKDCIPILHWEKIEQILEGLGYEIEIDRIPRKLAVMRAVLKLAKEVEK